MKAIVHSGDIGVKGLSYRNVQDVTPTTGEVRVKLKTSGLNHRDLFVLERHKPTDLPLILGSDGAGIVDAISEGVENVKVGDEVIINPSLGWKEKSDAPPSGFEIIGLPNDGTFAEYILVPSENVVRKPTYLTWEEAGVLSLGALTAYRALFTRGRIKPGMKVLIPGVGSGVATYLLQFALEVGATVYVTSRSKDKREQALTLGAEYALDSNEDWEKALGDVKMDLVIECVGAATFNKSLETLRKGGTLVTFGSSTGDNVQFNLRQFFYGQFNLLGSTMGSSDEYQEMIQFIEKHKIRPIVDRMFQLQEYKQAFDLLDEAKQFGKIGFYNEN